MQIKFDFHTHTRYSDGKCGHIEIVEAAEASGLKAIAFTDHGPGLPIGIAEEKLPQMLRDIDIAREDAGIPVLAGIEANVVDGGGSIDVDEKFIRKLDLLAVGIHHLGASDPIEMAQEYLARAIRAVERHEIAVFCHPFYFDVDLLQNLTSEEIEGFLRLAADNNVAMELNNKYKVPNDNFLRLCLREGVKLSLGSDAHRLSEVGNISWSLSALKRVGAKREDLVLDSFLR